MPASFLRLAQDIPAVEAIKSYPIFIGEAKVREIDNRKNFAPDFFACIQPVVNKGLIKQILFANPFLSKVSLAFFTIGIAIIKVHFSLRIFHQAGRNRTMLQTISMTHFMQSKCDHSSYKIPVINFVFAGTEC